MKNTAQMVKGQLWVHFDGRTFIYENPAQKKFGSKGAGKAKSGDLLSPMPGKVTKLLKKAGDKVAVGEVVLVMEAMKMEYTLKADVAGEITDLACKVGDQVALGKLLAKIKEDV
ncbi:MAG: acetyl-CoA carboxylase biotin carboxyl carrier protein subunit [Pseudobdellovibrionaceae bacterium]